MKDGDIKKDEWWRYALFFIVLALILLGFFHWTSNYHPTPDICQTAPNSQSCIDENLDAQNCQNDGYQC